MIQRILVVNPFGIGDVIFSMALVEALKSVLPHTAIGFLGNERTIDLLRMNPHLDAAHEFNRDHLRALRKKGLGSYVTGMWTHFKELKAQRYDTMFDLSLGREFSFAGFLLGIPRRIGFDYRHRGFFLTHKSIFGGYEGKHVVDWQLTLMRHIGRVPPPVLLRPPLKIPIEAEQRGRQFLESHGLGGPGGFFVVAPGGGRSWGENAVYKQWSPGRFAEVANAYAAEQSMGIVLLGDAGEQELLSGVRSGLSSPAAVAAGQPLPVVCAILKRARFFLGNDGGLLHLAHVLGVQTVSIYGPVDEQVYGPHGDTTLSQVLTAAVPCRPCYQRFHFPPCAHQRRCQEEIPVEKVLAALKKIS